MKAMQNRERESAGQHQGAAMKKGWQTKTLGEACEMYQPKTISGKDMVADGPYPVFGANGVIGRYNQFNHEEPQLLITCRGATCGSVNISAPRSWVTGNAMVVRPKSKSLEIRYLEYLFRGGIDISKAITGAAQPQITRTNLEPLEISFPESLAEQQRIVWLLDEAFVGLATAKANAEKNLQNARALFESHLQSVFAQRGPGWVEKSLGDLCDFLNGFAFKSGDAVSESQTQLVRMGNLYGNQLDLDRNPVFYPDNFSTENSRYILEEGDIIMSLTGTTGKEDYGFAVRIPDCGHTLLMNQRIMKFDTIRRDIIDDGYLLYYLRSRCFLDILYPTANGTRQANLSSVTMKLLLVPLPSLKEQKAIAVLLDELREETQRLFRLYERKIVTLEALKKSLLHQAFSGEL